MIFNKIQKYIWYETVSNNGHIKNMDMFLNNRVQSAGIYMNTGSYLYLDGRGRNNLHSTGVVVEAHVASLRSRHSQSHFQLLNSAHYSTGVILWSCVQLSHSTPTQRQVQPALKNTSCGYTSELLKQFKEISEDRRRQCLGPWGGPGQARGGSGSGVALRLLVFLLLLPLPSYI